MNLNMSHVAASAAAGPGGPGNVKQMTSLYAAGRQPSQTQIPMPKKFTSSLRVGLDSGSTSPSPVRSAGTSSVAARAQMFQSGSSTNGNSNNNNNINNMNGGGGGFHSRNGSSGSSNGSYSRNNSTPSSGASSPTKTVVSSPFNGKPTSNGSGYLGSSSAFSNGAPTSPSRTATNGGSSVAFNNGAPASPSRTATNGGSSVAFNNGAPASPSRTATNGGSSVAFNNGAPAISPTKPSPFVSNGGSSVALSSGAPPAAQSHGSPLSPNSAVDKWRIKFDESERKRKVLLTSSEKNAREAAELQRKLQQLQREHEATKRELKDREDKLTQLRTVSERVYKEYDQLKNRYEVETGAMHQAMSRASEWYKQNRELKRRSTAIMQKVIQVQPDGALLDLLADETDAAQAAKDEDDLEELRSTVQRLSGEVARLQSELNAARLQEFEAQEAAVCASTELDEARRIQNELRELRALKENMASAAALVQKEVAALRQQCELERQTARRMKSEADKAVKERNVMAHQSSLLAEALSQDDHLLPILAEVENLKRLLEEERCRVRELQALEGVGEASESARSDEVELLDERLKLAEEELRSAADRADRAERESSELRDRLAQAEKEIERRSAAPAPPPPPPPPMAPPMPPPPPPPPLPSLSPGGGVGGVKLRSRGGSGGSGASSATGSSEDLVNAERNAVQDMANLLGIPRKPQVPEAIPGGAIDNIINQIKGGRFTLKATEQNQQKEKKEEPPPAVTEMLNILGTLRRRPRASANAPVVSTDAPRDVAL